VQPREDEDGPVDLASRSAHPTGSVVGLLTATHPGPALAVTLVAGVLAVAEELPPGRVVLVVLAVLAGQLSIGWSNDLVDAARDRQVGRTDKPLAVGTVDPALVRAACAAALAAVVPLSFACGLGAGAVHLGCVAWAWAYNLGLKRTVWSWLPYALAFGVLPVFVTLAGGHAPVWWTAAAGALLGVGAHLVNTLPDLEDDRATGVRGLPHRLGATTTRVLAVVVLLVATLLLAGQATGLHPTARWATVAVAAALSAVALRGSGRAPFRAVVLLAVVDVIALAAAR
jgi:4-hydroxybenzoate polyprenyltransferase